MRFAVYHPWVYLTGGAERFLVETMRRSRHEWVLHTHHFAPDTTFTELRDLDVVPLGQVSLRRSLGPLVRAAASMATTRLPDTGSKGLLISSEGLGDLVAGRSQLPTAVYCHTPLKILHDPVTRASLRERAPVKSRVLDVLDRPFQVVDRGLWRRYEHVFANSVETKARIASARLAPVDRIEVAHPGVDVDRFVGPPDVWDREPVFLVAGRIQWQKNIELAIEALRLARATFGGGLRLVVAGAVDAKSVPYLATLREKAAGLPVEFVVDPSDPQLRALYAQATATLFTAPNEDFGIVPLESMASGTPVLAVRAGGPCETVVHGQTGWLLPNRPEDFARQMLAVAVTSPVDLARVREASRERARQFSWQTLVNRIDDVMEGLAHGRPVGVPSAVGSAVDAAQDLEELPTGIAPAAGRHLGDLGAPVE